MSSQRQTSGSRTRKLARAMLIAAVGIIAVLWAMSALFPILARAVGIGFDYGAPRPTPAVVVGYELSYRLNPESHWQTLAVGPDGFACDLLGSSAFLQEACVLATNVDPAWIASVAADRLNSEDTPAYVATTWRAVLVGDPALCARGELRDDRLAACRAAVNSGMATWENQGMSVKVVTRER